MRLRSALGRGCEAALAYYMESIHALGAELSVSTELAHVPEAVLALAAPVRRSNMLQLDWAGGSCELRAVGHVLRDQILYMNRSGFDAYQTTRADLPRVMQALEEHSAFYQLAADDHKTVFSRRHTKA